MGAVSRPMLGRAVQAIAIAGAFTLGIVIALMLPGTARGAEPVPAGADDAFSAPHDGVFSVDATNGVLANDTGMALVAELWTEPSYGTVLLSPDGGFAYTRTEPATTDTFEYLASDPDGLVTEAVQVTIRFANRPPDCDTIVLRDRPAGAMVEVDLSDACLDPDGDALVFAYQRPDVPDGSVWEADEQGHVRFLPPPDWTGTGTVVFTADDGLGESMPVAFAVEVIPES